MANWSDLKASVASIIKTNGSQQITGQLLQDVLNSIISNVGKDCAFAGIAIPTTNPGTPDGNVFYLATTAGTYSNFNGITIEAGEAVIFEWRGSWVKKNSGFATQEKLITLQEETDKKLSELASEVVTINSLSYTKEQSYDSYIMLMSICVKSLCIHYKNGYNGDMWVIDSNGIKNDNTLICTLFNLTTNKQIRLETVLSEVKNELVLLEYEDENYHVYATINPYLYLTSIQEAGGFSSDSYKRIFAEKKDENFALSVNVYSEYLFNLFEASKTDLNAIKGDILFLKNAIYTIKPSVEYVKNEDFELTTITSRVSNSNPYFCNNPIRKSGFLKSIVVKSDTTTSVSVLALRVNKDTLSYEILKDYGSFDINQGETTIVIDDFSLLLKEGDGIFVRMNDGYFYYKQLSSSNKIGYQLLNGSISQSTIITSYNTYLYETILEKYTGNVLSDIERINQRVINIESLTDVLSYNNIYSKEQVSSDNYLRLIYNSVVELSIHYKNGYNGDVWVTDSNGIKDDNTVVFTFLNLTYGNKVTLQKVLDEIRNEIVVLKGEYDDYDIYIAVNPYLYLNKVQEAGGKTSSGWKRIFTEKKSVDYAFEDVVYSEYAFNRLSFSGKEYASLQEDVKSLQEGLEAKYVEHEEYVEVFTDDFTTKKSDWVLGSSWVWDTENKNMRPTSVGGINLECVRLNRVYQCDKHIVRFNTVLYSDTILNICAQRTSNNTGEGESFWQINCAESMLKMYYAGAEYNSWRGVDTSRIQAQGDIGFNIVDGREYAVEVEKNDFTFALRLYDTISGKSSELTNIGWNAGRLQYYYTFSLGGGIPFSISKFRVSMINKPRVVFVGDSITEGVGMYSVDKNVSNCLYNRYAELARKKIGKCCISAVGGDVIDTIIKKFDSEYNIIKPKYLSIHIGTNGGITTNTEEKFKQIIDLCEAIGCFPILNIISCGGSGNYIAINQMLLRLSELDGYKGRFKYCRFDYATSVDNYPWIDSSHPTTISGKETRVNSSLMVDGTHPNGEGSKLMYDRFSIDVPEIFNA